MVKIKDIAEKCEVSIATVSKALNRSHEISEKTTQHVIRVANELGYIANSNARSLKTNRSYNLGLLYVDKSESGLEHEYFSVILNSIKKEAESLGYDVTFISNKIGNSRNSYLSHSRYRGCDGVILVSANFKDPEVINLVESDMPTITIDHLYNNRTAILSDNTKGLGEIVNYLYNQGHRKIAFIHGEDTTVTKERLASFHHACQQLNLEIPEEYIKEALYHLPKYSGLATRELLELENRPTVIIFPDDYSYMGGLTEIEKHSLKIPEDISVVGYDGIYLSRILRPILTTYVQDSEAIGKMAALKLIQMINKPKTFIAEQIVINGHLQEGQTVKKIR
ncbi:MAG: LacI family transcriptional regulator [Acholeplasmataceae bacterium]|nr:LacI family transcriptional regulator [Acholeplasmataceae bacterium]